MTSAFDSLRQFALVLQTCTCDTAGKHTTLVVHEFQKEIGVFVVNVLDAQFFETAVFFTNFWLVQGFVVTYGIIRMHISQEGREGG